MNTRQEIINTIDSIADPEALHAIHSYARSFEDAIPQDDLPPLTPARKKLADERLKAYKEDPAGNKDAFEHLEQMAS